MSRIQARFASLHRENRGALIPYLEANDPDWETSLNLLRQMPDAGADLIEIGMPFSDPSADGPTIQRAAARALQSGASICRTLDLVRRFREHDTHTPLILMGYTNPIDRYGPNKFCQDAADAGIDGLIIVDLPKEEADLIEAPARAASIDIIRLVAPNTPDSRLDYLLKDATGFVYYVSITGITGTKTASDSELANVIPRIRAYTDLPVVVGFGIRTPQQAAAAAKIGDGAVVASALISTLEQSLTAGDTADHAVSRVIAELSDLARGVRAP